MRSSNWRAASLPTGRVGDPIPRDAHRISTPSIIKWTLLAVALFCYGVTGVLSRAGGLAALAGILSFASSLTLGMQLAGNFRERFF